MKVALCTPSWDAKLWTLTAETYLREVLTSRHLVERLWVDHMSPELARDRFTKLLRSEGGEMDMVVMLDADQAVEVIPGARGVNGSRAKEGASFIDWIVARYLGTECMGSDGLACDRHRFKHEERRSILFGVTPLGLKSSTNTGLNYRRDEDGTVSWCGTGLMAIPNAAWARLKEGWPEPWFPSQDPHDPANLKGEKLHGQGEDVRMTMRARASGISIEPVSGLKVWHNPLWREYLTHEEP